MILMVDSGHSSGIRPSIQSIYACNLSVLQNDLAANRELCRGQISRTQRGVPRSQVGLQLVIKPEQVAVLNVGYHVVRDQGPKGTVRKIAGQAKPKR
jgi:hypothetical protein